MNSGVLFIVCLILAVSARAYEDEISNKEDDIEVEKKFLKALTSLLGGHFSGSFDKPVDFKCDKGYFLSDISSEHNNFYEDRKWNYGCRKISKWRGTCQRSEFVNGFDGFMTFQCPNSGFITGVYSEHSNAHEDRRFKFDCCELPAYCTQDCVFSDANKWDAQIQYSVPDGKVLRGVVSTHDNYYEDRRFSFMSCKLVKCWKPKRKPQQTLVAQQIQD